MTLPPFSASPLQELETVPLQHRILLKTWFSIKTIEAAHALITKQRFHNFLYFRSGSGLTISDDIVAVINCVPGTTPRHTLVFRDGWCSGCVAGTRGHRCKHVAAAALLCLGDNGEELYAVPRSFEQSPWDKIGVYLFEQPGGNRLEFSWSSSGKDTWLQVRGRDGFSLLVLSAPAASRELRELGLGSAGRSSSGSNLLHVLIERLVSMTCTDIEAELLARGRSGKKLHRDLSRWMWLARLLFLHNPWIKFELELDKQGLYRLHTPGKNPFFSLTMPRRRTWELLALLGPENYGLQRLPRAQTMQKVSFSDQGAISVTKCCRLHNGEVRGLAELEQYRFGNQYIVDNSVFSLAPIPAVERIEQKPVDTSGMSLFSFAAREQADKACHAYIVADEDIPSFLELNRQALRSDLHLVEPEIFEWTTATEPDALELTDMVEDKDWCYIAGYYLVGNSKINLCDLLTATADKQRYISGRTWFDLEHTSLRWFHALGKERLDKNGRVRLTRDELLLLGCQLPAITGEPVDKQQTGPLDFLLRQEGEESPVLDNKTEKHLRRYQALGVRWLLNLRRYGLGGILADDMGLGKTHQALALIGMATGPDDVVLIVCPAAVLYHWAEKQESFFPDLSLVVYHGPDRDLAAACKSRIIVTTYGVLRRDVSLLAEQSFHLLIFDEMHYLKNRKTEVHDAAMQLQARTVVGLSGTPLENSIEEVATLLGLCVPGLFTAQPVRRLMKGKPTNEQRQLIRRIIHPFILRRTREQVLTELPKLSEDIRFCGLHSDQIAAYRQAVDQARGVLDKLTSGEQIDDFTHILTTIIRLKQICNHLCLLEGCRDWDKYQSGKWTEFTRLINQCLEADLKVVVFSQFTSMLDIMEAWLKNRGVEHVSLRGDMGIKARTRNIKRFNTAGECRVCCASLLAGGTGIDLTGAQVVIHYDRWWNPAREEQATSRVHRMGQSRPVQVYKLVTIGTLEEKIHHLIEKKRTLAKELITEDEGSLFKQLDRHELADLFRLTG